MAFYNWRCASCGELTEVERKMADIDVVPDACHNCNTNSFTDRVPVGPQSKRVKGFILEGDKHWHNCEYGRYRAKDW
jgi:putative FmdB family regulatory protein